MNEDQGWPPNFPEPSIVITDQDTVICENGHPKVYIKTNRTGQVVYCGYCNTGFRYQDHGI
ncbi:MAG: hypothetical protein CBC91_07255 [Rickettsiales bacterium TMED131]|nr:MAG: hypothetical protein CBC91_07255 [Rickettsiales bacterium TMED131]